MGIRLSTTGFGGTLPEPPDPNAFRNPNSYAVGNRLFNVELRTIVEEYLDFQQIIPAIRKELARHLHDQNIDDVEISLATVGSDGRLEKALPSLYEIIVYIRMRHNGIQAKVDEEITQELADLVDSEQVQRAFQVDASEPLMKTGLFSHIEVKHLSSPHFLSYAGKPQKKEWPSRVIDALPLGNDETRLVEKGRGRLLDFMHQQEMSRHLISLEKIRHNNARQVNDRNGNDRFKGRDIRHYDVEAGYLAYDPEHGLAALKHGPIRMVQTLMIWKLLQAMRSRTDASQLLMSVPTPTTEKIEYLSNEGVLKIPTDRLTAEYATLYNAVLWWQHRASYQFHLHQKTPLEIGTQEGKELSESLRDLSVLSREIAAKPGN